MEQGSCNLSSPFHSLLMVLSVRCCQHGQERMSSVLNCRQSKDLMPHTVIYENNSAQLHICQRMFSTFLLTKMFKNAFYTRKSSTYIKSNSFKLGKASWCIHKYFGYLGYSSSEASQKPPQKRKASVKGFLSIVTFPFTSTGVIYGNQSIGTAKQHSEFLAKNENRALL